MFWFIFLLKKKVIHPNRNRVERAKVLTTTEHFSLLQFAMCEIFLLVACPKLSSRWSTCFGDILLEVQTTLIILKPFMQKKIDFRRSSIPLKCLTSSTLWVSPSYKCECLNTHIKLNSVKDETKWRMECGLISKSMVLPFSSAQTKEDFISLAQSTCQPPASF